MELSIQERLKDLRVERGLTLEQLEEQVNLSKSALGSYEAKDFKDISHYAIMNLIKGMYMSVQNKLPKERRWILPLPYHGYGLGKSQIIRPT